MLFKQYSFFKLIDYYRIVKTDGCILYLIFNAYSVLAVGFFLYPFKNEANMHDNFMSSIWTLWWMP